MIITAGWTSSGKRMSQRGLNSNIQCCPKPINQISKNPKKAVGKKEWALSSLHYLVYISLMCLLLVWCVRAAQRGASFCTSASISRGANSLMSHLDDEDERKLKKNCHLPGLNTKQTQIIFRSKIPGNVRDCFGSAPTSSLNVNISLAWNCLLFLPLSSFSLQFSLILESLCLPHTHALSGNDVNGVKCFQGPRGRKKEWFLENSEPALRKRQNALMFVAVLQHLFLSVTHMCVAYKSAVHLHIHLVQHVFFFLMVFWALEAAVSLSLTPSLFLILLSSHHVIFSFSYHYLAVWLHTISDLWDESEPPLGRQDTDEVHFTLCLASMFIFNSYRAGCS